MRSRVGVPAGSVPEVGAPASQWIGANFWSRTGGPRMWTRYDGRIVRDELAVLGEHGCNVTRSFCFWPDFVPEPGVLDEGVAERFGDFLEAHAELGLGTIPTVVVGHMSGENWDPSWRAGRDLYRDEWLVEQQSWFARELASRYARHRAVVGWLLSNEMPLYGGPAATEHIEAWARALVGALRESGATQPISLGDGAWGVEVTGNDNGFSLRALAPVVDFFGPHVYPMQDDEVRQLLTAAFQCELAGTFGKPVVLEEFGVSSAFASDENAALYYRQVLYTTLLAGAGGWIAWCNSDYDDLRDEDPYRHHVYEVGFGLTSSDGRPKETLHALASFARDAGELARDGSAPVKGDAVLVVPEHFERVLPFTIAEYRSDLRDVLLQSYIAAREADLPIAVERERDGLESGARLYLNPCAKLLTGPGIERLRELAAAGATVYLSYFAGSTPRQRGPWLAWLDEIFGVRHRLRYGLVDPIEGDEAVFQFVTDFGEIEAGARVPLRVSGEPSGRSYLPVDAAGAEIVAIDGHGRPALLRNPLGSGCTVLCTYPLEYLAARTPRVNPESTWRIYSALAELAGVERPVRADDPRVLAGLLRGRERDTALLVNCSPDALTVEPALEGAIELSPTEAVVSLGPFDVAAIALRRGATDRGPANDHLSERDLVLQATSVVGQGESQGERRDAGA